MTDKDKDRIECAIRHIDSCLDVDPWARDIAIDAMRRLLEQESYRHITGKLEDLISRQSAYETLTDYYHHTTQTQHDALRDALSRVPSVPEPEITDEQAILHLQSTGWMQMHDREMYESGLREQLADDSWSYDSIISCKDAIVRLPSAQLEPEQITTSEQPVSDRLGVKTCKTCTDTISRQGAIDALRRRLNG